MTTTALTIRNDKPMTKSVLGWNEVSVFVNDWLKFLDVAPTTFTTYKAGLKRFLKWTTDNGIEHFDRDAVIKYREYLLANIAPSTCRLYITCVRLFVKFLNSEKHLPNVTDNLKGVKLNTDTHSRDALTVDQAATVINSMSGTDEKSLRDKAIVALMLATGLRCIEVTRLDAGDIEKRGNLLFLNVHGKARQGKIDSVILPVQCSKLIFEYLDSKTNRNNNCNSTDALFTATSNRNYGQRLQTQTISRLCKKALVDAGFESKRLTAHSLRHSFATNALSAGVELRLVSKALRHKSVTVTEIYLHDLERIENQATQIVSDLIFRGNRNVKETYCGGKASIPMFVNY